MSELLSVVRHQITRILIWSADSMVNFIISLAISIGFIFGGNWLVYSMPTAVSKAAMEKAYNYASGVSEKYKTVKQHVDNETPWFVTGKGYVEDIKLKLDQATGKLVEAQHALDANAISRDPDEKLSYANRISTYASEADTLLREIENKLNQNRELKASARTKYNDAQNQVSSTNEELGAAQKRFDEESGQYLSKYTDPMGGLLTTANEKKSSVLQYLGTAQFYLPEDNVAGNGDPTGALQAIDQALSQLADIRTNAGSVVKGLDDQAAAKQNAEPTTKQAENLYPSTLEYVNNVRQNTGYWLNTSLETLKAAKTKADDARNLLNAGGGVDYPLALQTAQESINLSNQAKAQADGEVAAAQAATNGLATIDRKIDAVNGHIGSASSALSTLQQYHDRSLWGSVAGNIDAVSGSIQKARDYQNIARSYLALDVQRFTEAEANVNAGINALSQADSGLSEIEALRDKLERARGEWSSCEAAGNAGISSASYNVNSYGGYSSSARSEYDAAVGLLNSARSKAQSGFYEQACAQARQAEAAGRKAKQAYDDEQERIAEEKRRKEREEQERQQQIEQQKRDEEAQRQREQQQREEEQRRQQQQNSGGDSGGGYSGGGYSGGSSGGGYSSGGGDYSDNDYGDSYNDNDF